MDSLNIPVTVVTVTVVTEILNLKRTTKFSFPFYCKLLFCGLIGYWPLDELVDGNVFEDVTGNGHDAFIPENKVIGWTENVRFDGK